MGKIKKLVWSNLLILLLVVPLFSYRSVEVKNPVLDALFWNKFAEPIEMLYLLTNKGMLFKVSSYCETTVFVDFFSIEQELKKYKIKIKDIIVVIHNHQVEKGFSNSDIRQYKKFKEKGFNGMFCIWLWRNKKIYQLEE